MNLPNKLTLTRILLVPVFMIFVSMSQYFTAGLQSPAGTSLPVSSLPWPASPIIWTAIWPASGTW